MKKVRVRALLMGGQACILYGAAEFSRDVDIAVDAAPANLVRLRKALAALRAERIFFPDLEPGHLRRGHACHFRCHATGVEGLRVDVMSVMRGADPFHSLWARRERVSLPGVGSVTVVALPDLVCVKKTQRDKDWPMLRRLVEADMTRGTRSRSNARRTFWLQECRTPELLVRLAERFPALARRVAETRPAVAAAFVGRLRAVERCLRVEEDRERAADRRYWAPLRRELEQWRMGRPRPAASTAGTQP
ncbi:MAG: hypothetical protein HZA54_02445 [Planctomycetes bacterium]|nr:hypothetical protein [Planctomycetota bacterium]